MYKTAMGVRLVVISKNCNTKPFSGVILEVFIEKVYVIHALECFAW